MKKLENLGKKLTRNEQKKLIGGTYGCIPYGRPCVINVDRCCAGQCLSYSPNPFGSSNAICR